MWRTVIMVSLIFSSSFSSASISRRSTDALLNLERLSARWLLRVSESLPHRWPLKPSISQVSPAWTSPKECPESIKSSTTPKTSPPPSSPSTSMTHPRTAPFLSKIMLRSYCWARCCIRLRKSMVYRSAHSTSSLIPRSWLNSTSNSVSRTSKTQSTAPSRAKSKNHKSSAPTPSASSQSARPISCSNSRTSGEN